MRSIRHVSQANSWEQLSPSGTVPSSRNSHTAVWSSAANGFYVFGGYNGAGPESVFLNDLWFYARQETFHEEMHSIRHVSQANSWEQLSPSGTAPSIRYEPRAVWSPAADGFYTFGGFDAGVGRVLRARQHVSRLRCGVAGVTDEDIATTYGSTTVRPARAIASLRGAFFVEDVEAIFREEMRSIRHVSQANSWQADGFYVFGGSPD
ncbi:gefF, partial [Symbiodinium necroappetens]